MSTTKVVFSPNLDLLRAVAVSCVLAAHLLDAFGWHSYGSLGRIGVIIFFVHTSLVLMDSLERLERDARSDWQLVVGFWVRRAFRIYPLSVLFVVLVAVFRIPMYPGSGYVWIGWAGFLANLGLVQNLVYKPDIMAVLWSLPLEVQMYVLLPALYFAVRGGRRYRSLALWAGAVALGLTVVPISERLSVFRYGPCFASGVVAYDLARSRVERWRLPAWVWPIGVAAAIILFGPADNFSIGAKIERAWGVSLLLGVLWANVREGRYGVLEPVLHWVAEHSYGIYLGHTVVIWLAMFEITRAPMWLRLAAMVVGLVAVPAGLYVGIEKPLVLAGGHVARRIMRKTEQQELISTS